MHKHIENWDISDWTEADAWEALTERLCENNGYYLWSVVDDGERLMLRRPNTEIEGESWLEHEKDEIMHFCDSLGFVKALQAKDKLASAFHVGYTRDGACTKCLKAVSTFTKVESGT